MNSYFVGNATQIISLDNTRVINSSTESSLLTGVVQGSGIGPVLGLFLTYIDDLAQLLERNGIQAKFCADDVIVYVEISTVDFLKAQTALDLISIWASEWQLQLSVSKCNILDIGHVPHDTTHTPIQLMDLCYLV